MIEIRPTILEVPHEQIPQVLKKIAPLVKNVHIDVEDGLFVPRKNDFTPEFVAGLKKDFALGLDVHLMVQDPLSLVEDYIQAGASLISFHYESHNRVPEVLEKIKNRGARSCLALKLETALALSKPFWDEVEEILLMSIEPGYGGQPLKAEIIPRIKELRQLGYGGKIKIDGGIRVGTASACAQAGADILVAGTALFDHGNIRDNYELLRADVSREK